MTRHQHEGERDGEENGGGEHPRGRGGGRDRLEPGHDRPHAQRQRDEHPPHTKNEQVPRLQGLGPTIKR